MDVVTLFALIVFGVSWFFFRRQPEHEVSARLFFRTGMWIAVVIWLLGMVNRAVQ